jgi:hypothetical protein
MIGLFEIQPLLELFAYTIALFTGGYIGIHLLDEEKNYGKLIVLSVISILIPNIPVHPLGISYALSKIIKQELIGVFAQIYTLSSIGFFTGCISTVIIEFFISIKMFWILVLSVIIVELTASLFVLISLVK